MYCTVQNCTHCTGCTGTVPVLLQMTCICTCTVYLSESFPAWKLNNNNNNNNTTGTTTPTTAALRVFLKCRTARGLVVASYMYGYYSCKLRSVWPTCTSSKVQYMYAVPGTVLVRAGFVTSFLLRHLHVAGPTGTELLLLLQTITGALADTTVQHRYR